MMIGDWLWEIRGKYGLWERINFWMSHKGSVKRIKNKRYRRK